MVLIYDLDKLMKQLQYKTMRQDFKGHRKSNFLRQCHLPANQKYVKLLNVRFKETHV